MQAARDGANQLHLEVASGRVGSVVEALAGHPIVSLTSHEPSLEEIFLHHYGARADGDR